MEGSLGTFPMRHDDGYASRWSSLISGVLIGIALVAIAGLLGALA